MPALTSLLLAGGLAAAGASTATSIVASGKAKDASQAAAQAQADQQAKLEADAKERALSEESQGAAVAARNQAYAAQKQRLAGSAGRSSTFLTSPTGLSDTAPVTGGKTLLGS